MAKAKTTKQGVTTTARKKQPNVPPLVQKALEVTWVLKGAIKNVQIAYIRVCTLLDQVRRENLWQVLKHTDIESYAEERLQLKRSSLYRYLQIYDWMAVSHKAWLEPHPKGYIPELSDADDLMWIEAELQRKDLDPAKKAGLEELQKKGMNGQLRDDELVKWRRKGHSKDTSLKSFLAQLRSVRRRGARLVGLPPEAIADLDAAIAVVEKASTATE